MGEWIAVGSTGHRGYLAGAEAEWGAGVLVLHAWWGLTNDCTDVCDRLAERGFVALAPDLYTGAATAATIVEAESLVNVHDSAPQVAHNVVLSAIDQLRELQAVNGGQIGIIGFSLGAYWALHASQVRPDDVSAVVTVYGTNDGDYSTARAAYLGHFAERDSFEPLEVVQGIETSIRDAGHDVTFHVYPGTGHWFAEPSRSDAYNAQAAELLWDRTLAFLTEHLQ
jgi:carboxymethylenebutenolidase